MAGVVNFPLPTPNLENHPFSAVGYCLFNIFSAMLHIWRPSPASETSVCAPQLWQGIRFTQIPVLVLPIVSVNGVSGKNFTYSWFWPLHLNMFSNLQNAKLQSNYKVAFETFLPCYCFCRFRSCEDELKTILQRRVSKSLTSDIWRRTSVKCRVTVTRITLYQHFRAAMANRMCGTFNECSECVSLPKQTNGSLEVMKQLSKPAEKGNSLRLSRRWPRRLHFFRNWHRISWYIGTQTSEKSAAFRCIS